MTTKTLSKALAATMYLHRVEASKGAANIIERGAIDLFHSQSYDVLYALFESDLSESKKDDDERKVAIILAAIAAALAARIGRDVQVMRPGLIAALSSAILNAGLTKYGVTADLRAIDAERFLREHGAELVKDINTYTRERLGRMLADAFARGDSIDVLASRIMAGFDDMTYARAARIARTEVVRAWSYAEMQSAELMEKAGFTMVKEWLLGPAHPRYDPCDHNHEQGAIPIHQPFSTADMAPPQHPHCGCSLITYPAPGKAQPWGAVVAGAVPYPPAWFDQGETHER